MTGYSLFQTMIQRFRLRRHGPRHTGRSKVGGSVPHDGVPAGKVPDKTDGQRSLEYLLGMLSTDVSVARGGKEQRRRCHNGGDDVRLRILRWGSGPGHRK